MNKIMILIFFFSPIFLNAESSGTCVLPDAIRPINSYEKIKITMETEKAIKALLKEGKKLDAIRVLRLECKDMNLKENKDVIESIKI